MGYSAHQVEEGSLYGLESFSALPNRCDADLPKRACFKILTLFTSGPIDDAHWIIVPSEIRL
jgi:hypothetical protein